MKSLRKTFGNSVGIFKLRELHHRRRGRKKRSQSSSTVGLLMPHKQLLNLIICLTPFKINSQLSSYKRAN